MDDLEFDFVKFVDGHKCKDPRSAGQQSGDTVQLTRTGSDGTADMRIWKLGDVLFAKHLRTGATVCVPWSNVRWARPYVAQKAGAAK